LVSVSKALAESFINAVRRSLKKNLPVETPVQLEITIFSGRLELKSLGLSL
jgi:serine/threonine-protein kinase RsbW